MKKSKFTLLVTTTAIIISFYGFLPDGDRDPDYKPSYKPSYNNPVVVYGPLNDSPSSFLFESFESTTFPPQEWIKFSPDAGSGWTRVTAGTSPLPGWNGGIVTTPPGGGIGAAYCTWSTGGPVSNDQWLVTPQITNVGFDDSLSFWVQCPGYANIKYGDSLLIMVSTTTPTLQAFTRATVLTWVPSSPDTNWSRKSYKLTDFPGVNPGSNIYIAFREIAHNNSEFGAALLLDLVQIQKAITNLQSNSAHIPEKYSLSQNFPNPFNPSTKIDFNIPERGFVSLKVYDMLGKEVANLVNKELIAGNYSFDFDASHLNSGIYFYTLRTENNSFTKKMMLIK